MIDAEEFVLEAQEKGRQLLLHHIHLIKYWQDPAAVNNSWTAER